MLPLELAPAQRLNSPGKLWPPDVTVKHSCHQMPETPPMEPFVVVVPEHVLVSGNLVVSCLVISSLICCAVWGGLSTPLLITTEPSPVGFVTVRVGSLFVAAQPGGSVTDSADVEAVEDPAGGVVVWTGLGVPAGEGLGNTPALVWFLALRNAYAVPQPAMTTIRPMTALTISTQGVRWTGA